MVIPPRIGIQLRLHPRETSSPSAIPKDDPIPVSEGVPAYITVGQHKVGEYMYKVITYQFYFAVNGAISPLGTCFPTSKRLGYHEHDVERISICVNPISGRPHLVYFGAHSYPQGTWMRWKHCEKTEDGRLVAYVARGSHAMYPAPCRYLRIFGFGNDVCSYRGRHIDILPDQLVPATYTLFAPGVVIADSIPPLPPVSFTAWQRFTLPFSLRPRKK